VQGAGGINLLASGSDNITVGTSDTTGTLLVLDTKTGSGDPTGVNGGLYYNSNSGKFRCYENGLWKNCLGNTYDLEFHSDAGANATLTNQANSEQFLANSNRNIMLADLTNYTQVRLLSRVVTGSASANTPRVYVEYSTSFTTTVGSYATIGSSAVENSLTTAGYVDSGWINLATGAKAEVYVTILQNGGDAAADPALGPTIVRFR
jgi:hypothetical protein